MKKTEHLEFMQQKILDKLIFIFFAISLIAASYIAFEELTSGVYHRVFNLYLPMLFLLGLITFYKKIFHLLRFHILIVLIVSLAITELIFWGYNSLAFFLFLSSSILASLLRKPIAGWLSFILSMFSILFIIILYDNSLIPASSPEQLNASEWKNWISPLIIFIMMHVAVLLIAQYIINNLLITLKEVEIQSRELKSDKEALEKTAYIDMVTGLPNNKRIMLDITEAMANHENLEYPMSQVLIELLDFGNINIKYGVEFGNKVLQIIGQRFQKIEGARAYRMNGASFLIDCKKQEREICVFKIKECLKVPISINKQIVPVNYKGAHATAPGDVSNPTLLLPSLMMIINSWGTNTPNTIVPYNEVQNKKFIRSSRLREKLTEALVNGELEVLIQPRMDASSGKISGGELLMRWNSSSFGPVSPSEFIPISEKDERIFELTHFLMEQSLKLHDVFTPDQESPFRISVNISPNIIQAKRMEEYLTYSRQLHSDFTYEFEITEGVLLGINDQIRKEMEKIRNIGIKVSIDDFGTGYSNLEYIQDLSADILKIDKKFIDGLPHNEKQEHLVEAMINMADALKLRTVAEGVEHMDQIEWLQDKGIGEIQGFVVAKPMRFPDLQEYYDSHDREKWNRRHYDLSREN